MIFTSRFTVLRSYVWLGRGLKEQISQLVTIRRWNGIRPNSTLSILAWCRSHLCGDDQRKSHRKDWNKIWCWNLESLLLLLGKNEDYAVNLETLYIVFLICQCAIYIWIRISCKNDMEYSINGLLIYESLFVCLLLFQW